MPDASVQVSVYPVLFGDVDVYTHLAQAAVPAFFLAGDDYQLPVRSPAAAAAAAAAEAALLAADSVPASSMSLLDTADMGVTSNRHVTCYNTAHRVTPPGFTVRKVESCHAMPHADGTLEILELCKRKSGGSSSRQRWWDEKRVRVWLPPGFRPEVAPPGGWPALLMCDGQVR
jgi:hypothetical protein